MIDESIYIEDLVNEHPEVIAPLADLGIVCIACGEPVWGTLEELINQKGLGNSEEILARINNLIVDNE